MSDFIQGVEDAVNMAFFLMTVQTILLAGILAILGALLIQKRG